jgi:hypothetical protein
MGTETTVTLVKAEIISVPLINTTNM